MHMGGRQAVLVKNQTFTREGCEKRNLIYCLLCHHEQRKTGLQVMLGCNSRKRVGSTGSVHPLSWQLGCSGCQEQAWNCPHFEHDTRRKGSCPLKEERSFPNGGFPQAGGLAK